MGLIAAVIRKQPHYLPPVELQEKTQQFSRYPLVHALHPTPAVTLLALTVEHARHPPLILEDVDGTTLTLGYWRRRSQPHALSDEMPLDLQAILDLEGEFAAIRFDAQTGTVHALLDRFGGRPLFLHETPQAIFLSSDVMFLLHLSGTPALDPLGIFQLFAMEHTLGERTNRLGVTQLQPGTHLQASAQGLKQTQYWQLAHTEMPPTDVDAHAHAVAEAMRASCRWRTQLFAGQNVAMSLSGGLDSRFIAASLPEPHEVTALTIGAENSRELQVARQVAQLLGMRHQALELDDQPLSSVIQPLFQLTGGLLPLHHPATTLQLNDKLLALGLTVTLGGGPGDVLAGSYIPDAGYLTAPLDWAIRDFTARLTHKIPWLHKIFHPDVYPELARRCHEAVRESLQQTPGRTGAQRVSAWAMAWRQPSFTFLGPGIHSDDLVDISPHLDYAYSDLMLQLTPEQLWQKNFYKRMLYLEFPQLRDVVYANTGEKLTGNFVLPRPRDRFLQTLARAVPKLPPKLDRHASTLYRTLLAWLGPQQAYSFFHYLADDAPLMALLENSLAHAPELQTLLDVPAVQKLVQNRHKLPPQDQMRAASLLGNLVTVGMMVKGPFE